MRNTTQEIPLSQDVSRRQMPLIIGLMVFLLSILLACAMAIGGSFSRLDTSLSKKFTISFTPAIEKIDEAGEVSKTDITNQIIELIKSETAIEKHELISDEKISALLAPAKDQLGLIDSADIPAIIDIYLQNDAVFDAEGFTQKLQKISPVIQLDGHNQWHHSLKTLGIASKAVTICLALMVVLAILFTVTLVTRSSLQAHQSIINTLRLIGARSGYISRQFQWQAFRVSIIGGFSGVILALPTLYGIVFMTKKLGLEDLFQTSFYLPTLSIIISVPIIISILSLAVSRLSVNRMIRTFEA